MKEKRMTKEKKSYYDYFWERIEEKRDEVRFQVDGEDYNCEQTKELMQLSEDESYMQGFTLDSDGNVIAVELNRITEK